VSGGGHDRDLAELHHLDLLLVAGGTQHDRERVAVDVDLRALVIE
jgi:hypothetical protein